MKLHSSIRGVSVVLLVSSVSVAMAQAPSIEQLVHDTVAAALDQVYEAGTYTVEPVPVAAAVRLKPCTQMTAQIRGKHLHGRVPVHVRCIAPATWSLYASAQVEVVVPVLVAQRGIARGQRITDELVALEPKPLHQLRGQTVTRLEDALGKVARRSLNAGQALTMNQLTVPMAVEKGERVHILAHTGRVQIQAYGTALASGAIGEQIRVRNDMSQRIIQPWIIAPGTVATSPMTSPPERKIARVD